LDIVEPGKICYKGTMETLISSARRRAALAALLQDPNPEVRTAAAHSLERIDARGNLPELLDLLKRGSLPEKIKAIFALGEIGGDKVLPALTYCAGRPEPDIRIAALEILGALAIPETFPVVAANIADPNQAVRAKAISAIGNFRDHRAASFLIPCLDADDGLIEAEAVRALGKVGLPECEVQILSLLGSRHETTRIAAAEALGTLPL
jgi:HEAT repeat protein